MTISRLPLFVSRHTTHSFTRKQTTDIHSTHIRIHISVHGHTCMLAHTHTLSPQCHSRGLRAHWGKSSSNAAHLPVARKRRVASRSWGDILTFISLSEGLKAEKSCFLSRWVIFFLVLLSAEERKSWASDKLNVFLCSRHMRTRATSVTPSKSNGVTGWLNLSYPKLIAFSGNVAAVFFWEEQAIGGYAVSLAHS